MKTLAGMPFRDDKVLSREECHRRRVFLDDREIASILMVTGCSSDGRAILTKQICYGPLVEFAKEKWEWNFLDVDVLKALRESNFANDLKARRDAGEFSDVCTVLADDGSLEVVLVEPKPPEPDHETKQLPAETRDSMT